MFRRYPLALRGLLPYSFLQAEYSSWLRIFEKINFVYANYKHKLFDDYRHFIILIYDSVFECISKNCDYEVFEGTI